MTAKVRSRALQGRLTETIWLRISWRWFRSTFMSLDPEAPASSTNNLFEMWRSFPNLGQEQELHQPWVNFLRSFQAGSKAPTTLEHLAASLAFLFGGLCLVTLKCIVWGYKHALSLILTGPLAFQPAAGIYYGNTSVPPEQERWGPYVHLTSDTAEVEGLKTDRVLKIHHSHENVHRRLIFTSGRKKAAVSNG